MTKPPGKRGVPNGLAPCELGPARSLLVPIEGETCRLRVLLSSRLACLARSLSFPLYSAQGPTEGDLVLPGKALSVWWAPGLFPSRREL